MVLRWLSFSFVVLLFAGYSLRGQVPYNFEQILILTLCLGGYIFWKQNKNEVLDKSFKIWVLLLITYWLCLVLISFYHFSFGEVTAQKLQIVSLILGFIVLGWTILKLKPSIDYFWYFLMTATLFMGAWLVMEIQAIGLDAFLQGARMGSKYGNEIKFGVYGNALLIIMMGGLIWAYKKSPLILVIWVLFIFINLIIVVSSQSRTAWIGWPEAIIGWGGYYLFLILRSHISESKKMVIILVPVLFLSLLSSNSLVKNIFSDRIDAFVNNVSAYIDGSNWYTSIGVRFVMYEASVNLITKSPFVGYGADSFEEIIKIESSKIIMERFQEEHPGIELSHVHNQFLMTWIQYGIVPVLILLLFFVFTLRFFWLGMRSSEPESKPIFIAGIVFSVATFMAFLPESPLEYSGYSAHYWLFLTLVFVFSVIEKNKLIQFKESSHV